jgi:hypothetical protein
MKAAPSALRASMRFLTVRARATTAPLGMQRGVDATGLGAIIAPDAFHASLGFVPVGEAYLPDPGKSVRYLERRL